METRIDNPSRRLNRLPRPVHSHPPAKYRALVAAALAALAVGAIAIGALAIGRLAIGRARIRSLQISELRVGRLRIDEQPDVGSRDRPTSRPSRRPDHGFRQDGAIR